jgi:CheY-like chemotaxis protein
VYPLKTTPMPARIVVVHDDPEFIDRTVTALLAAGYDVTAFTDTISALAALEAAQWLELLITRVIFPPGQPNGVALARMARVKKPGVKLLFAALPETQEHTAGLGEFLPAPVDPADIVTLVGKMLD